MYGDARLLVKDKLNHPRHVEDVLRRLEQAFGQPAILMAGMVKLVAKMQKLDEDLGNLAQFLSDVEAVDFFFFFR